jgi:Peptide N-acetyl-beta-D-glucosaminyl asparaginase amidase A
MSLRHTLAGLFCALAATAAAAQPVPQQPPTLGSANTVTADPPVPRPRGTPCKVQLFTDQRFADFSSKSFDYAPGCPGPWKKIVLEADYSVEAGRQFDRTATLFIGGVNVYYGTTAEPGRVVARSWHVERDLTGYAALLSVPQKGRADLGNLVNATYTASLWGSADLVFYPAEREDDGERSARPADLVLPFAADPTGGTTALFSPTDALSQTFTLPRNVERAYVDVILQHQGANDEFWYTCVPDALTGALQSCGGTAFREGELTIDGAPAGVVPVYPWIFTGGIDPLLWRPIPAVQALAFEPYRVDVTPFAGLLADGKAHTFAFTVFNDSQYFQTTAALLVHLDHGARRTSGKVTRNTLGPPAPMVTTNLATAADGTVTGSVGTTSSRSFVLEGWLDTSHGRVRSEVRQSLSFSNQQAFVVPGPTSSLAYVQQIVQTTVIDSRSSSEGEGGRRSEASHRSWPLSVAFSAPPDGTFESSIDQGYELVEEVRGEGEERVSVVSNRVRPHDVYPTAQGQANAQDYFSASSDGRCYSRSLTAASGKLTSIVDGARCGPGEGRE